MPGFALLFVENFLFTASFNAVSLLPPYLHSLGAGKSLIGLFTSINTLALMLGVVVFGRQLVRLDRPKALRWGFLLLVLSYVGMYAFQTQLWALFAFKIVGSVAFVFGFSMLMNMVYDLVPPAQQTGRIALYGISGLLTNPVTAFVGEALVKWGGGPTLFLFGAVLAVGAWAITFAIKDEKERHKSVEDVHLLEVIRSPQMLPLVTLGFLFGSAWSVYQTYLPGFTQERLGLANLTAYAVPFAGVSIGARFLFSKMLDTAPHRRLLALGFSAMLASYGLVLFTRDWWVLWLVGGLYGLAHSVLFPLISSLYVRRAPAGQRGSYNNAFIFFNNFGAFVLVPLLGGLADLWGYSSLFGAMAVVTTICLGIALFLL